MNSKWSLRLAAVTFLALLIALPARAVVPVPVPAAPEEGDSWWAQVKDDWDEAWERAWSRNADDEATAVEVDVDVDTDWELDWSGEGHAPGRVEFRYADEGYLGVALTGDWLDWERLPMVFSADTQVWTLSLDLEPGRHHYRFIVSEADGEWEAIDPANTQALRLDDRGWVSVLDIAGGESGDWRREQDAGWRSRERARSELRREAPDEEDLDLVYQRVDGLLLGISPEHLGEADFEMSARGTLGYGFESERWSASLALLQPLVPGNRLWLRLYGVSGTSFAPRTGVGDLENSLAMAFFREDYRDWYRREGAAASLVAAAPDWLRVELGLRSEDHESLTNRSTWSVRHGHFRPNLPVDDGTLRSVFAGLRLGAPLSYLEFAWERAGEDVLGGDFHYSLAEATLRSRLPVGPGQHLDLCLKGGANLLGELPLQRRYLMGGFGTVRGYDYQSLLVPAIATPAPLYGGERMLLAKAEYGVELLDELGLFALYDAGMAWADRDADVQLDDLKDSAGLGIGFDSEDADLRLNILRTLDGSEQTAVELRLERAF